MSQDQLDRMEATVVELRDDIKELKRKLYEGNGKPSWAIRLDRIEQQIKLLAFVGAIFVASFLTGIADWITNHMPWRS